MSFKDEVREFLISRRAHVTPAQAGLPNSGEERRVPGLRREEVAGLAGLSVGYYTRLERGHIGGASESVLGSIARVLQLNDVERQYLFDLARAATSSSHERFQKKHASTRVNSSTQRVLDSMSIPAVIWNAQQDVIAANVMGRALYRQQFEAEHPNFSRFIFLDPRAEDYYVELPLIRRYNAAMLRREAGRDPLNEELTALIGELSTLSPEFRQAWADRDVHEHKCGTKIYNHPDVGVVELEYNVFGVPGEKGLSLATYSADAGSETAVKLAALAGLAGLAEPTRLAENTDQQFIHE